MKKFLFYFIYVLFFNLYVVQGSAQSCPTINSYAIYKVSDNGDGTCNYTIQVCYTTTGNKSVQVVVNCDGTNIVDQCLSVSGTNCQSINFTCGCNATISGSITPWSGGSCNGSSCTATSISSPTIFQLMSFNEKLIRRGNKIFLHWDIVSGSAMEDYGVSYSLIGNNFSPLLNAGNGIAMMDEVEVEASGFYRIFATQAGNLLYSKIIPVTVNKSMDIQIYPNPATDFIQITGDISNTKVELFSSFGKKIPCILTVHNTLDIRLLPNGLYYLNFLQDQKREIRKFIKMN